MTGQNIFIATRKTQRLTNLNRHMKPQYLERSFETVSCLQLKQLKGVFGSGRISVHLPIEHLTFVSTFLLNILSNLIK